MAKKKNNNSSKKSTRSKSTGLKKVEKSVKSTARRAVRSKSLRPLVIVVIIILVLAIIAFAVLYFFVWDMRFPWMPPDETPVVTEGNMPDIITEDLSIHFLELGNKYTGDSVLIKSGNTEILIDAGSRQSSASVLVPYIEKFCTDDKLEYVIATHADQDHIAAFIGTNAYPGIYKSFEIGTIIDFSKTNKSMTSESGNNTLYGNYIAARNEAVSNGAVRYSALECVREQNGASKSYTIGNNISFEILYQRYYEESSSDENNYSVCMMLTQGTKNYLFTGDLEKDGEDSLVTSNPNLPEVELYKAGHHGSKTSSNDVLLDKIKPKRVVVTCCAGSDEYTKINDSQFPTQAMINRVAKHTDQIFVTTIASKNEQGYESMNGTIVIASNTAEIKISVYCSNSVTILRQTEWFISNRTWPT